MTIVYPVKRRQFLVGTAGLASAAVTGLPAISQEGEKLPAYVAWKDPSDVIVHTSETLETTRAAQGDALITPSSDLYIRNNLPAPSDEIVADRDAWEMSIEGVAEPGAITLGDLKLLGSETVVAVLQCSGNGRAFFDHEASGSQWATGAAGNVIWTGVPVRAVVDAMGGIKGDMSFLTGTGGEEIPDGLPPESIQVERSVPVAAMEQAILAWDMNGEPIPLAHGGPLRLIVPGYYGVNNVKYLKRLAFTAEESPAKIQQTGYRVRPVGVSGDPSQPSMYEMSVKSWITGPLEDASTGRVRIEGLAMGGTSAVTGVEVSTDGGNNWQEAELLGPDMGPYAWRPFFLVVDLEAGMHTLASRATNGNGDTQPEEFEPNERGYGHNGWRGHAVEVNIG
ncbi:sulfite oxidase [Palleronia sp. LCG004]|uniref:SorT family sulfite dehydrogenase catalytic subunit n=1 Tax=Palleronia sp. LCG004 TaxID=3079304 RepID=UPI0029432A57|nr:sulfite oxidase [Palleronia sp. LCG004]WOI55503.1 sulfite oxidase [Palleronia sp. LCG004]